ncbi:MAG: hypothetical protein ACYC5N_08380 [Endomicrobiales bacterium]
MKKTDRWLIILLSIFIVIPLVLPLLQGKFILPFDEWGSDTLTLNYPMKAELSSDLKHLSIPFWSENIFSGFPLHSEGEGGFLHPLNLLIFGLIPLPYSFSIATLVVFIVSFLGTVLFVRMLGLGLIPAFFAGIVFTFSGFQIVHIRHLSLKYV